jgi:hypothetical protein
MTNTVLLDDYIEKSGYKRSYIAKALGITRSSLFLKCTNKNEFKASEIEMMCQLLNIGLADRMKIFFAN